MSNIHSISDSFGTLHVADLARTAGVTPATVRYYSRVGILSPNRDPENGYRCFSRADLRRVIFTRQAQDLGLTIGDIKVILKLVDLGESPCDEVKSLIERRQVCVTEQIAQLQETERRISAAMQTWDTMGELVPERDELCPLIERMVTNDGLRPTRRGYNGVQPRLASVGL